MNFNEGINIKEVDGLYIMTDKDISRFAECAAQAYKEYPLFKYLTKNKFEHNIMKNVIESSICSIKTGVVGLSTSEDANAVAIFIPPHYTGSKTLPFLLGGGYKLFFIAPVGIFLRLLRYENYAMKLKKKYTDHNCWYLYNVTVKPQYQNQGMSTRILSPMFEYLDRIGQDCYLETHEENNVGFYQQFGFQLLEVSKIPRTNITQYSMLRKSKKTNSKGV